MWRAKMAAERLAVADAKSIAGTALLIAVFGSGAVGLLLEASALGIWMKGAYLHPTPRINAFTVGTGLTPLPAFAWIVYVWTRTRPKRLLDIVFRIVVSCVLVLGAGYGVLAAMVSAFFVG